MRHERPHDFVREIDVRACHHALVIGIGRRAIEDALAAEPGRGPDDKALAMLLADICRRKVAADINAFAA